MRIFRRKGRTKVHSDRLLIKCGDCKNKLEIYYDREDKENLLEIGGVIGTRQEWIKIFKEINLI